MYRLRFKIFEQRQRARKAALAKIERAGANAGFWLIE